MGTTKLDKKRINPISFFAAAGVLRCRLSQVFKDAGSHRLPFHERNGVTFFCSNELEALKQLKPPHHNNVIALRPSYGSQSISQYPNPAA